MAVKYLVSGGEGALGKTVISMLLQRGEKVRVLMSELSDTRIYRNNPNIEICYGISTDKDSMREFFELDDPRSAVLFHTDEYVSLSDATNLTMRRVNVIGAENIVDMCLKRKVGKLVYLSSAYALNPEVSGEEITIHFDRNKVEGEYAKSKAEAAAYVMEKVALNRLNAVMVLPTFIIGPGYSEDYEINKVLNSYLNNGTIPPKGGGRAFVDVRDVANAMLTLADKGEPGAGYIVSGNYKTSDEFFKDVNDIQGIDAPVKTASKLVMSKSLAKLVDFYYKITHKENPREAYMLFSENPDARFEDNSNGILSETTISFKDSLNDTIKGAQQGGIQAAAAVLPKSEKKSSDVPQSRFEKRSSAEAMEARLKQSQNVTSKANAVSATPSEAPQRPAHTRPATAAAQAAAAAKAAAEAEEKKENAPKSIIPPANLKGTDDKKEKDDAPRRFGGTPTKFTSVEAPQKSIIPKEEPKAAAPAAPKSEPVKSIIPPATPKAEPAKSIIPPAAPKAEPVKSIIPPAAPSATAPKSPEAPKPAETPRTAPAASGFPRPGFARTSAPAAPRAEAPKAEEPKAEAPKAVETPKETPKPAEAPKAAPSGFPRPGFARTSAPAAPRAEAPKVEEPKAEEPKAEETKAEAPKAVETPKEAPKPAEEAPKAAPVTSGFPRPGFARTSAPAAPRAEAPKAEDPKVEAPKAEAPKVEAPKAEEPKAEPPKTTANDLFGASMAGSGSGLGSGLGLGSESSFADDGNTLHSDNSKQSVNYAFMNAQAEHNPFKPATSSDPSPFKAAQPAASSADSGPFKPVQSSVSAPFRSGAGQASDPNPFKPAPSAAPKAEPVQPSFNPAFKPAEPAAPAPKADTSFNKDDSKFAFSESDLSDLEDQIDKFGIPTGPVVPPGIFAPPPKPGQN